MQRVFLLLLLVSSSLCAGKTSNLGTRTGLAVCQPDTCALLSEVAALREKMAAQDKQLNALLSASSSTKVAFTATLRKAVGPFHQHTPVKYQRILSNIGNSYNPATGIFTARTRGMYYFSYTMYNDGQPNSVLTLMKNSQRMVSTWDTTRGDTQDSATNAAVLQLEAGDSVFVRLWAKRVLYDDAMYYNTFSGFLLFTL